MWGKRKKLTLNFFKSHISLKLFKYFPPIHNKMHTFTIAASNSLEKHFRIVRFSSFQFYRHLFT